MRAVIGIDKFIEQYDISFESCLNDPEIFLLLREHLRQGLNEEPLLFVEAVREYKTLRTHVERFVRAKMIFSNFIEEGAPYQINLPWNVSKLVTETLPKTTEHQCDVTLFDSCTTCIQQQILTGWFSSFKYSDLFERFLFEKLRAHGDDYMKQIGTLKIREEKHQPIVNFIKTDDDHYESLDKGQTAAAYIASTLPIEDNSIASGNYALRGWILTQKICAIRFLLPLFTAFSMVAVQLIAWGVMYNNSQTSLADLNKQNMIGLSTYIAEVCNSALYSSPYTARVIHSELQRRLVAGTLNVDDFSTYASYFWSVTLDFESVSGVYLGMPSSAFFEYDRLPDASFVVSQQYPFIDQRNYSIADPKTGLAIGAPYRYVYGYNPTKRVWYIAAVASKGEIWSPIFQFSSLRWGLTLAKPVYNLTDSQQPLLACIGINVDLEAISVTLRNTTVKTSRGKSFIVDRQGQLVGASAGIVYTLQSRVPAVNSTDQHIAAVSRYILQRYGSFARIVQNKTDTLLINTVVDDIDSFINVVNYRPDINIDWIIFVIVPVDDIMADVYNGNIITFSINGTLLVVSIMIGFAMMLFITYPLDKLSQQMRQVSQWNFDNMRKTPSMFWEIRSLQYSFYSMVYGLQSFRKYVPDSVISRTIERKQQIKKDMDNKKIALFVMEFPNFALISDLIPPAELKETMSQVLQAITNSVEIEKGFMDLYVGNSIMAFFGIPDKLSNNELGACKAALKCIQRIKRMRTQWKEKGMPQIRFQVAVHSGRAIIGTFGRASNQNYTAMGEVVDTAALLPALCEDHDEEILITAPVYEKVKFYYCCRAIDVMDNGTIICCIVAERANASSDECFFETVTMETMNRFTDTSVQAALEYLKVAMETKHESVILNRLKDRLEQIQTQNIHTRVHKTGGLLQGKGEEMITISDHNELA